MCVAHAHSYPCILRQWWSGQAVLPVGTQCHTVAHYRLVTLSQTHPSYCGYCRLLPRIERGGGGGCVEVRGEGGGEGGGWR